MNSSLVARLTMREAAAKLEEWDAWSKTLGHDPYCRTQDWDYQDHIGETLDDPNRPCSCHLSTMPTRGA